MQTVPSLNITYTEEKGVRPAYMLSSTAFSDQCHIAARRALRKLTPGAYQCSGGLMRTKPRAGGARCGSGNQPQSPQAMCSSSLFHRAAAVVS